MRKIIPARTKSFLDQELQSAVLAVVVAVEVVAGNTFVVQAVEEPSVVQQGLTVALSELGS